MLTKTCNHDVSYCYQHQQPASAHSLYIKHTKQAKEKRDATKPVFLIQPKSRWGVEKRAASVVMVLVSLKALKKVFPVDFNNYAKKTCTNFPTSFNIIFNFPNELRKINI